MLAAVGMLLLGSAAGFTAVMNPPLRSGVARYAVEVPVRSFEGEAVGSESLDLRTTKSGKDMYVLHRKYVHERRKARAGTASTKTRGEVRGGGRKPYKQKGTGNARRGSTRSPLIVGGGVAHGPRPKNWNNKKINKKEALLAIGIAIQNKAPQTIVVDELCGKLQSPPKTKSVVKLMADLDLDATKNTIMIVDDYDPVLDKSQSNIPHLEMRLQDQITVSDMLWANQVVFSKPAFDWVKAKYGKLVEA
ncbi:hypothetical protein CTAYLR_009843 [Chrysophaeum taylorii]|uniref:Large ribosomal subunit protein uL4c n=1 Tax=Chrysophaeum taylorii TaxID=2483200 RepID=A0AAD7XJY1_9STRA|nr:hypothetical protein CTAYLR_009843 [Chrysophaeum taylorii]